ncbi:synaptonemal complex central element protein 1-like [Rousettus aegyptiacus]|uniref:synaptonemal complex central element protein 1-like n=1 Tax=Rousettus aegyptiacus TaxID=9407 RepID=UPI00168D7F83|nr:synaptonemal complex central element protein 1-like [Rousettus aegyptiacus]
MAGESEPLDVEPPEVVEEAEAGKGNEDKLASPNRGKRRETSSHYNNEILAWTFPQSPLLLDPVILVFISTGQTKSSKKSEDLLAMVKKLQKEGSLEPQIEDLINRINELQQAKKSGEELGEAQGLWETLHRDLDALNGEKVHLEEVLSKKQEALRILQLHCQMKDSEAQRLHVKEQLDLMGHHKDFWEFQASSLSSQMLKQRLTWEIRSLQRSKEQLLTEENLARAKLQQVEQRLRLPPVVEGAPAVNDALKAELEKFGGHGPAQTQSTPGDPADKGEAGPELVGTRREEDLEPPVELALAPS